MIFISIYFGGIFETKDSASFLLVQTQQCSRNRTYLILEQKRKLLRLGYFPHNTRVYISKFRYMILMTYSQPYRNRNSCFPSYFPAKKLDLRDVKSELCFLTCTKFKLFLFKYFLSLFISQVYSWSFEIFINLYS